MISIHSFASPPLGIQFTKNGSMIKRLRKKCVSYVEFDFRSFIICEIVAVTKSLTIFFLKIYFSPILINEHEICLYIKLFVSKALKNLIFQNNSFATLLKTQTLLEIELESLTQPYLT